MGLFISSYDTLAEYNLVKDNLLKPHVSHIEENDSVDYIPFEETPQHDYIEIGGLKWATMNIGASSVTDAGLYFQWGDISGYTASQVGRGSGQKAFMWADYKYGNGTSSPGATGMTKYNSTDGLTTLQSTDDAAIVNWGGAWRMPTTAEFQALGNAVNTTWTTDYQGTGVSGLVCTDKTDSSKVLFFPAAGVALEGDIEYLGNFMIHLKR